MPLGQFREIVAALNDIHDEVMGTYKLKCGGSEPSAFFDAILADLDKLSGVAMVEAATGTIAEVAQPSVNASKRHKRKWMKVPSSLNHS